MKEKKRYAETSKKRARKADDSENIDEYVERLMKSTDDGEATSAGIVASAGQSEFKITPGGASSSSRPKESADGMA